MSVSGRNAPLSPVSLGGSEWSVSKYQLDQSRPIGRGNLASPPLSGGSNGATSMDGFPSRPPSAPRSNGGGPSPPPSIGRSSTGLYARSESGRDSQRVDIDDTILYSHYVTLKSFLSSRDPNPKNPPNKARDKLVRLSSVQFYELSTDVFDELNRRQAVSRLPPNAPNRPSAFLLPDQSFHPKRNQARQRLASLGPPRFRDLGADVYHELERRFPRFADSEFGQGGMSMRNGPISRTGTPVSGGFPPRGPNRMRQPSDASSLRGPPSADPYGVPPSPGLPPPDMNRPMQKQVNQNNTIVPNKSTMVEEDDSGVDDEDAFSPNAPANVGRGPNTSEADKRRLQEYQDEIREMREKMEGMEDELKKKDEEINHMVDSERARTSAANLEKKDWDDLRIGLESKLAEAQSLNDSMKQELKRVRQDHDEQTRQLRDQIDEVQEAASQQVGSAELQRENDELRESLRDQQQVTIQVRREAQDFLREMKALSEKSEATWEKHQQMEKTIESLEREVQDWKDRYARTKAQSGSMRGSVYGLSLDPAAAQAVRDKGFLDEQGLVKDIHVTKFQLSIDELLQRARRESSEKVIEAMKSVVVSVRRITKDLDVIAPNDDIAQQQGKLKAKVSAMANGLITASKNFASSAGLAPITLLDASASHLTAAVVELLRVVKIRPTPASELDDDDDGSTTPGETASFFSQRSTRPVSPQESLPPPPPFQGLAGIRASVDSSAYSPVNSPRESVEPYSARSTNLNGLSNGNTMTNGMGYAGINKNTPFSASAYSIQEQDNRIDDLKLFLEDQTALLVSDIQSLVGSIRGDAGIQQLSNQIASINAVVAKIISETQKTGNGSLVMRLGECRERLLEANDRGEDMAHAGVSTSDRDWRMWTQTLPPIAFEIARETKELVQTVSRLVIGGDDFS